VSVKPALFLAVLISSPACGCAPKAQRPGVSELIAQPWLPKAPPLPEPGGGVIRVSTVDGLFKAVGEVKPGGTILLADGRYDLPRRLDLTVDDVKLRGASGRREAVVLDGGGIGELVGFIGCSGVTVADLTIQNARWNGFKFDGRKKSRRVTIYNCVVHNVWQRGIKAGVGPADVRVQYCLLYNDRPKRFSDDPADEPAPAKFNGNYIGGIDAMGARNWTVSDNVFAGINGRTGEGRGAIFLWRGSRDWVIERNVIIDCDGGVCLGNASGREKQRFHCRGCVVRNNFVVRAHEKGLLAIHTEDCRIINNTVHDPESRLGRLVRLIGYNRGLLVANNLVSGPGIQNHSETPVRFERNLEKDLTGFFVDPRMGDLHLKRGPPGVIDRARPLAEVTEDIDRRPRGPRPDIGAHETGDGE
jgi:hypothetical protein